MDSRQGISAPSLHGGHISAEEKADRHGAPAVHPGHERQDLGGKSHCPQGASARWETHTGSDSQHTAWTGQNGRSLPAD